MMTWFETFLDISYSALTNDFIVVSACPAGWCVGSSGNGDHVWNALILDLLSTVRTAMMFHQRIVTNRCL